MPALADGEASTGMSIDFTWHPIDCEQRAWQYVRSAESFCGVCPVDACCHEINECAEAMGARSGYEGCGQYLSCSARCVDTNLGATSPPGPQLISDCVEACLDLGGNTPPGGWPAAFGPALEGLLECYMAAPAVTVVDADGNPAPPNFDEDADAGWMDPANPTPWRWMPVTGASDAGNAIPGACFDTCVSCPKGAGSGCPVFCEREPQGGGCL